ncbi:glutamine synthetase [Plakobranchus ocellatus]|uniref:Lengsin n=1 Tax=Plakobranchus ocellatus TaxID=259542 RepID=A0AAV3YPB9_9GAST|nr:glutamine synthetase [Plakobranchus ocellatus]
MAYLDRDEHFFCDRGNEAKMASEIQQYENFEAYDFIVLKIYDVHGYEKGRFVSRQKMHDIMKHGLGLDGGVCFYGVKGQPANHPAFRKDVDFANFRLMPILSTLKPCLIKSEHGDYKTASVLCRLIRHDGTLEMSTPREVTLGALQRLESEFGLKIKSTFEAEFNIIDQRTAKALAHFTKWCSVTAVQNAQTLLMTLTKAMNEIGVKMDTIMSEHGPGQFEVTFDVTEGIEAADMAAEFKVASYVFLKSKGYDASFMTRLYPDQGCANGFHFNFSLWDSNGRNVFADPKDPYKLSSFGRHWLAGMLAHAPAMTAICSPTINCYRRIGTPYAPSYVNWSPENRDSTFRLKTEPGNNVFIENRIPSSSCNTHLVLACTLVAGMDGVRRQLPLPEPLETSKILPPTLDKALAALEADTILSDALGQKFYRSVPHEMIQLALRMYHLPEVIQVMLDDSFGGFRMRFSTNNYTTNWINLEVGIAMGCTISPILFVMAMEVS